jgi:hypothetical protein
MTTLDAARPKRRWYVPTIKLVGTALCHGHESREYKAESGTTLLFIPGSGDGR